MTNIQQLNDHAIFLSAHDPPMLLDRGNLGMLGAGRLSKEDGLGGEIQRMDRNSGRHACVHKPPQTAQMSHFLGKPGI